MLFVIGQWSIEAGNNNRQEKLQTTNCMTIFSKIIAGEIPCYKIAEDEKFFSFLDINPLVEGHTLVIPKLEIDNFFDIPDEYLQRDFLICQAHCKSH